jgi:DNA primase
VGLIPQSFIDELIARADIVEVIGSRVPGLKKAGREWKACCPFHGEKTPSFWVSPEKQFYHCFGCGAHGTALRFLMEHDRMPFPDAVEELAGRLGLTVPREAGGPDTARVEEPLFELMAQVAAFYSERLQRDTRAQAYVQRRGLTPETVERFGIGYAPNAWNEVLRRFGTSPEARRQLTEAGLIVEKTEAREGDRHYDRFRDRLMFPIRDARGRVIAFGGRIIDQGEPKYLNSPETVLFHKGRELYALHEARRARGQLQRLLVVEGYMDAVRLHQSGIPYAVATLGTATTPEHLRRLFRIVSEVVFSFDGDKAGRAAAWRALRHALPEARDGREIRFLFLPDGHDPDSLVGEEGRERFEERVKTQTQPLSDYLVEHLKAEIDLSHEEGWSRFSEGAKPLFAKVPEGIFRDLLLKRLAGEIGMKVEQLEKRWYGNGSAAGQSNPAAARPAAFRKGGGKVRSGNRSLIQQAIEALLHFPAIAGEISAAERDRLNGCTERGIEHLCELLDDLKARPASVSAQVIERWAGKKVVEHFQRLLAQPAVLADAAAALAELKAVLAGLVRLEAERRIKMLEEKMQGSLSLSLEELEELRRLHGRRRAQ